MSIQIGDPVVSATAGSVLFVDSAVKLAEDNVGFYFDPATNTLKSKDKSTSASADFRVSTGDATASQNYDSGSLTLDTGDGGSNVTSAAAGNSGDLLLQTGDGGDSSTGAGGDAGSIILQPGSFGTGGTNGVSGSTLVRAPSSTSEPIFAVQNSDGSASHWSVSNTGTLSGTQPIAVTHTGTSLTTTFMVTAGGTKNNDFAAAIVNATASSTTANKVKTALAALSTGGWTGTGAVNRAFYANATGGTKNYAAFFESGDVVAKNGRIGAGVEDPGARLHIASGSTSLPAFKLSPGAKLTAAEAGAMEFDGTQLWITQTGGTRKTLTQQIANVLDFGANGDGSTDDAQAVKDAVASLITTGGIVWFPPNLIYRINSSIDVRSDFPIFIMSQQQAAPLLTPGSIIKPGPNITNGMFRWRRPLGNAAYVAGGGGLIGVHIMDTAPRGFGNGNGNGFVLDSAVNIEDCFYFLIQNCSFTQINGRAIDLGNASVVRLMGCNINYCGNADGSTLYPSIDVRGFSNSYAGLWATDCIFHSSFGAPYINIGAAQSVDLLRCYFESSEAFTASQKIVASAGGGVRCEFSRFHADEAAAVELKGIRSAVFNCRFTQSTTAAPMILVEALYCSIVGNEFNGGTGKAIAYGGENNGYGVIADNILYSTGNIDALAAQYVDITGNIVRHTNTSETHVIKASDHGTVVGNILEGAGTGSLKGIRGDATLIANNSIRNFAGVGIECTSANDVVIGNYLESTAGITYVGGCVARGNKGYTTSASDTDLVDAITLNSETGLLTTRSLTTAAGGTYLLTLNNNLITFGTRVTATVGRGGGMTQGFPQLLDVQIGSGQAFIRILNQDLGTGAFNAPVNIFFSVDN